MDAMSDAIEGADVMLYGVSLKYKESANVSRTAAYMPYAWCQCTCSERVADSLLLCCCHDSVEWCALGVLHNLGLPICTAAQLPDSPMSTAPNSQCPVQSY